MIAGSGCQSRSGAREADSLVQRPCAGVVVDDAEHEGGPALGARPVEGRLHQTPTDAPAAGVGPDGEHPQLGLPGTGDLGDRRPGRDGGRRSEQRPARVVDGEHGAVRRPARRVPQHLQVAVRFVDVTAGVRGRRQLPDRPVLGRVGDPDRTVGPGDGPRPGPRPRRGRGRRRATVTDSTGQAHPDTVGPAGPDPTGAHRAGERPAATAGARAATVQSSTRTGTQAPPGSSDGRSSTPLHAGRVSTGAARPGHASREPASGSPASTCWAAGSR